MADITVPQLPATTILYRSGLLLNEDSTTGADPYLPRKLDIGFLLNAINENKVHLEQILIEQVDSTNFTVKAGTKYSFNNGTNNLQIAEPNDRGFSLGTGNIPSTNGTYYLYCENSNVPLEAIEIGVYRATTNAPTYNAIKGGLYETANSNGKALAKYTVNAGVISNFTVFNGDIIIGVNNPTSISIIPYKVGMYFVDKSNETVYFSKGKSSLNDWFQLSGGSANPIIENDSPIATNTSPESPGQIYLDQTNGRIYIAIADLAPTDFIPVSQEPRVQAAFDVTDPDFLGQIQIDTFNKVAYVGYQKGFGSNNWRRIDNVILQDTITPIGNYAPDFTGQIYIWQKAGNDLVYISTGKGNNQLWELVSQKILQSTVSPVGVTTPDFIGQIYVDTTNDDAYISVGSLNADWKAITARSDPATKGVLNLVSTGIVTGGLITSNGTIAINVTAGVARFSNSYSDPDNPIINDISFGPFENATIPNIGVQTTTLVYVNSSGNLSFENTPFDPNDIRNQCLLGIIFHPEDVIDSISNIKANNIIHPNLNITDISFVLGSIKLQGLEIDPNGNLTFHRTGGTLFSMGSNYDFSKQNPNFKTIAGQNPAQFRYVYRDGLGGWNYEIITTSVKPNQWDDGDGVLGAVGLNDWTVQRVYLSPFSGNIFIQYGQLVYETQPEALDGIRTEEFEQAEGFGSLLFLGWIVIQQGAVNLQDETECNIINYNPRSSGGSGPSAAITSLQQAYDNSVQPQITTSGSGASFQIKQGTGLDSDIQFEILDGINSPSFQVSGESVYLNKTIDANNNSSVLITDTLGEIKPGGRREFYISGVLDGGFITQATANTIDITDGYGVITDYSTDANNPVQTEVFWTGQTGITVPTAAPQYQIVIDNLGIAQVIVGTATTEQRRDNIVLGSVLTDSVANIISVYNIPKIATGIGDALDDFVRYNGNEVKGLNISPAVGTPTLEIKTDSGTIFILGGNWHTDRKNPNIRTIIGSTSPILNYFTADGTINETTTLIQVDDYEPDGAGTVTSIGSPNSRAAIHRVYIGINGNYYVSYPQRFYDSLSSAISSLTSDNTLHISPENINNLVLLGYIITTRANTDLNNENNTEIVDAEGNGTGGAGGGEVNTASNRLAENPGVTHGVFFQKSGVNLEFKNITAGANITLTADNDQITIAGPVSSGEANTASNQGAGEGLVLAKNGVDLPFKTLVAGSNVTLTPGADTITIASTGGTPSGSQIETISFSRADTGDVIPQGSPRYVGMYLSSDATFNTFSFHISTVTTPGIVQFAVYNESKVLQRSGSISIDANPDKIYTGTFSSPISLTKGFYYLGVLCASGQANASFYQITGSATPKKNSFEGTGGQSTFPATETGNGNSGKFYWFALGV